MHAAVVGRRGEGLNYGPEDSLERKRSSRKLRNSRGPFAAFWKTLHRRIQ